MNYVFLVFDDNMSDIYESSFMLQRFNKYINNI
jgi:hypothetical protein